MSLKSTIQQIKEAGFGYVKVELEAQLNRPYSGDDGEYETCDDCEGRGYVDCEDCDGEGYTEIELTRPDGSVSDVTEEVTCDNCNGEGNIDCSPCDAEGEVYRTGDDGEFASEDYCHEFLMEHISDEAKKAIVYSKFYNDGSVDSELTFTIPVDKVSVLPEIIDSFNKLAEANGEGMDIDGAGMHIAVLPHESRGVYPVTRSFMLDPDKLQNFRVEVTKLLPALFIAATSGNFTRALNYRHPKIDDDKYSAIHIVGGRCFEYRLFETCYQRPEAIFEYLETIARTLEYFKDPSKKVETIGKEFAFYDREGLKGFTATPDQVRIIKKQLKLVIGKDVTLKSFQAKREIDLSVQSRRKEYNRLLTRSKRLYKEAKSSYDFAISQPLTEYEGARLRMNQEYGYYEGTGWTQEKKIAHVRGLSEPGTEEQFISRNVLSMRLSAAVAV